CQHSLGVDNVRPALEEVRADPCWNARGLEIERQARDVELLGRHTEQHRKAVLEVGTSFSRAPHLAGDKGHLLIRPRKVKLTAQLSRPADGGQMTSLFTQLNALAQDP